MFLKALVVAAVLVGVAGPASAKCRPVNEGGDYQHCVTFDEYAAANVGMPKTRVERIFDTHGISARRDALDSNPLLPENSQESMRYREVREYPECVGPGSPAGKVVTVEYSTRHPRTRARVLNFA